MNKGYKIIITKILKNEILYFFVKMEGFTIRNEEIIVDNIKVFEIGYDDNSVVLGMCVNNNVYYVFISKESITILFRGKEHKKFIYNGDNYIIQNNISVRFISYAVTRNKIVFSGGNNSQKQVLLKYFEKLFI